MSFFEKIQKFDPFSKKLIVFAIIFILAIPFIFFIRKNFQKGLKEFEKEEFLKTFNIQEIKEKKSEFEDTLTKLEDELESELKKFEGIEKHFSTSSYSTE